MNARNVATGATFAIIPGAVIVGIALIVQTLVGVAGQRDQLPAQAGRPTVTVTVTIPPRQPSSTPEPKPAGSGEGTAVGVVVAAERPGRTGPDGGTEPEPGGGADHPPASPAECPRGQLLTVRLPIALLPCGIAVIGGSNPQPTEGP